MLGKLKSSLHFLWRRVLSGYGNCSKCGCGQYTKSSEGGDYCECGHSYGDHW
jgi:hypothetical protein